MEQRPLVKTEILRPGRRTGGLSASRLLRRLASWSLALTPLSGCVVPIPPPIASSMETIPSDCREVNSRSAILQGVLRDSLRECAADLRAANPACARIEKLSQLNRYYAHASGRCVERGETAGLPSAGEQAAVREEIATLSARIDKVL